MRRGRGPEDAHFIYYALRHMDTDELFMLLRSYTDGDWMDFKKIAMDYEAVTGVKVTIGVSPENWWEADALAAVGVPVVIYDKLDRRSEGDKYSDTTECISCDWTRLTDFLSTRATSAA